MLVDTNILLYSVDESSPFHQACRSWMEEALNGPRRVGLPWQSLTGFLRIATNHRAMENPLPPGDAWEVVEQWLASPSTWVPSPTQGYHTILAKLIRDLDLRGNLIPDAALAALCIQDGLAVVSADSDFARFREITWINPLWAENA